MQAHASVESSCLASRPYPAAVSVYETLTFVMFLLVDARSRSARQPFTSPAKTVLNDDAKITYAIFGSWTRFVCSVKGGIFR